MSSRRPRREGVPEPKLPRCPAHLAGEARREWHRMGGKLLAFGLVTEIDGAALALYCQAWARWVEAEGQLTKFGTVIKSPNGYPIQSPYLAIANKAMDQMTRLLVEFGMSPSSRSRVTVEQPPAFSLRQQATPRPLDDDPRVLLLQEMKRDKRTEGGSNAG